jgi:hypothetical protein
MNNEIASVRLQLLLRNARDLCVEVSCGAGPLERNWSNCLIAAAAASRIFWNDRRTLRQKLIPRFGADASLGKMEKLRIA